MMEKIPLKTIFSRKLKNGNYVILAANSEPLVVEEEFANCISQKSDTLEACDANTISIFKDSGFFADALSDTSIPVEPKGITWNVLRYGVFVIAIIALLGILLTIPFIGIPFGNRIISTNVPLWKSIIFMAGFSVLTTMLHEIMHMLYARTWSNQRGGLNIILKKSVVTVTMTHIWVWSFWGRLTAVSAGIISDLFILAICSVFRLYSDSWIMSAAASILWLRILWQFRFHRKSDGRLIITVILDNPVIAMEDENDSDFSNKNDILIWKIFNVIGMGVEILVFVLWIIPFIYNICANILLAF